MPASALSQLSASPAGSPSLAADRLVTQADQPEECPCSIDKKDAHGDRHGLGACRRRRRARGRGHELVVTHVRAGAGRDTALTGDTADKVKAAALEKVPGGTVLRAEEGGPYSTKYHAHARRSDASEVVVLVDASFEATSVQTRPARGHGGRGHGGRREAALTGTTAAKVKAAALEKVPGGTVLRSERGGPGNTAYHAHVRRSDGSEVVVLVNAEFEATSVQTRPAGRRGGPGHRGGPGGGHGPRP